ncbi:reverse transcriptase family protein [Wolbachia pipientis]|nr:reverse transcriptase family protein [Wolbachia pipientis]
MIYFRLLWLVESQAALPNEQMGFRPNRSCSDNLVALTNNIQASFLAGEVMAVAFLDISGAFDNVLPETIISEFRRIGAPARIRKFVENITHRMVHFVEEGHLTQGFEFNKGTPQASTLSPLLFNVSIRDMDLHLHPDTQFLQYADDMVIFSSFARAGDAIKCLQSSLDILCSYLGDRGLILSLSKTKWILFFKKKYQDRDILSLKLHIEAQPVEKITKTRFLGIILDSKLNGVEH